MNPSSIRRPKEIELKNYAIQVELQLPKKVYNENKTELIDILIAPIIVFLEKKDGEEKPVLPIAEEMFNQEIYEKFNRFTYSIGKLGRLAELNLDCLSDFIESYFSKNKIEEVLERNTKCRECKRYNIQENLNKLTFGNLRNILSCIVKTDEKLHIIEILNNSQKRNNFTKIYSDYILDRDYYTHGKLYFRYPDFSPILRVKNQHGKDEYFEFKKEIFEDNLRTYLYLNSALNQMKKIIEK